MEEVTLETFFEIARKKKKKWLKHTERADNLLEQWDTVGTAGNVAIIFGAMFHERDISMHLVHGLQVCDR